MIITTILIIINMNIIIIFIMMGLIGVRHVKEGGHERHLHRASARIAHGICLSLIFPLITSFHFIFHHFASFSIIIIVIVIIGIVLTIILITPSLLSFAWALSCWCYLPIFFLIHIYNHRQHNDHCRRNIIIIMMGAWMTNGV